VPAAEGWYVAIEDPFDPSRNLTTLALEVGGVATSSILKRTWMQDGSRRHHVIDPATQTCATTDLAAVTVIARAGWEAEVHATAALLAGSERALDYLERHELDGIATTLDGTTSMSPALEAAGVSEWSAA
jgi:thiamine biosynthesis lipoprotein